VNSHLPWRMNFDFESVLQGIGPNKKERVTLERIYFFCCDAGNAEPVLIEGPWDSDWENYLKEIVGQLPPIIRTDTRTRPFCADDSDLELAKRLNSKLTSFEVAKKTGTGDPEELIIYNFQQLLRNFSPSQTWILRPPFGSSGRGNHVLGKGYGTLQNSEKRISFPVLMAPLRKRLLDIGVEVSQGGEIDDLWINLIDRQGRWNGVLLYPDLQQTLKKIDRLQLPDLYEAPWEEIANSYYQMGAKGPLFIDSYFYKEMGECRFRPLVEVNYRKTMGLLARKIQSRFAPREPVLMIKDRSDKQFPLLWDHPFDKAKGQGIFSLTNAPNSKAPGPIQLWLVAGCELTESFYQEWSSNSNY